MSGINDLLNQVESGLGLIQEALTELKSQFPVEDNDPVEDDIDPVPFSYPTEGQILFFDANKDVYQDTDLTLKAESLNDAVKGWKDQGLNQYLVTSTTINPKYNPQVEAFGNKPGIFFDAGSMLWGITPNSLIGNLEESQVIFVFSHLMTNALPSKHPIFVEAKGEQPDWGNKHTYYVADSTSGEAGNISIRHGSNYWVKTPDFGFNDGKIHVCRITTKRNSDNIRFDIKIYVDEVLRTSYTAFSDPIVADRIVFGRTWIGSDQFYTGYLAKFMAYNYVDDGAIARLVMQEYNTAFLASQVVPERDPAYPVYGWGSSAVGAGLNAPVLNVTSLQSNDAGSLRKAVQTPGRKLIKTGINGNISLGQNPLNITFPYITIDCSNHPVNIMDGGVSITASHVIIKNARVRPGLNSYNALSNASSVDAIQALHGAHCIHISNSDFEWSLDEIMDIWGTDGDPYEITFLYAIFAQPLHHATHPKGDHGFGILLDRGYSKISFLRSLIGAFDIRDRQPKIVGASGGYELDFVNCVIPFAYEAPLLGCPLVMNFQGNYILNRSGQQAYDIRLSGGTSEMARASKVFLSDNITELANGTERASIVRLNDAYASEIPLVDTRIEMPLGLPILSAREAYYDVLEHAGAFPRDVLTDKIIQNIKTRTIRLINDPVEVGGYPSMVEL